MRAARQKLYWKFQIIAWCAWVTNETLLYINLFGWKWEWMISAVLNVIFGISITHYYRYLNEKHQWLNRKSSFVVRTQVIAIGGIAFLLTLFNIFIDHFILQTNFQMYLNAFYLLQVFFNFSKPVSIWILIYYFYQNSQKQLVMQRKNDQLELTVQESEGRILRAQMNPHFVFNALNSIKALILENPKKARESINNLSKLLRSSLLTERKKTIPLSEEMETILEYLELEKIRYEERLTYSIEIQDACKNIQVPPMLIQTLVENGIKHGISQTIAGGTIQIKGICKENHAEISVQNPGKLNEDILEDDKGVGLENSKFRLKLLFGDKAEISLHQLPNEKVEALITIPNINQKKL